MAIVTAYATVSNEGQLIPANRKRLLNDIKCFKGCQVELIIKKKNRRSKNQNSLLWGIIYAEIVIALRELGNEVDAEWVHEWCKKEFNPIHVLGPGGEIIGTAGGSTTEMNKEEMSIYWDKIIRWAGEFLCLHIPMPNEKLSLFN
jgi:hypothetical protein